MQLAKSTNFDPKRRSVQAAIDTSVMRGAASEGAPARVPARGAARPILATASAAAESNPFVGEDVLNLDAYGGRTIARREISCVEVSAAYLDHIERINPKFNAIVSLRAREQIIAEAREKDALLSQGIWQKCELADGSVRSRLGSPPGKTAPRVRACDLLDFCQRRFRFYFAMAILTRSSVPAVQSFVERPMASFNDRVGVSENAQGSQPVACSTGVESAVSLVAQPTLSLISRLTGRLRSWRRRAHERAELAQMSQAELHDIGVLSADRWEEINKPFWRE
jgi:uncharacterized protein YjiS (DUF1127 family)